MLGDSHINLFKTIEEENGIKLWLDIDDSFTHRLYKNGGFCSLCMQIEGILFDY